MHQIYAEYLAGYSFKFRLKQQMRLVLDNNDWRAGVSVSIQYVGVYLFDKYHLKLSLADKSVYMFMSWSCTVFE